MAVRVTVQAKVKFGKYAANKNNVPAVIGRAIVNILAVNSRSIRLFECLYLEVKRSLSLGPIAKAKTGKLSVTKLSQRIWSAKSGKGKPINKAKIIIAISLKLVENKNKIT